LVITHTWLAASLLLCGEVAFAQTVDVDKEPAAIIELGGAAGVDLKDSGSSFGPDFAVEFTPIKNWLEIEAGVTPLFTRHSTEWDIDILFKKPWTLSETAELMIGLGPEWIRSKQFGLVTNSFAGEAVLDFMFWPTGRHRIGFFVEPGYDYSFGRMHERSFGISWGLLIGIRGR
jgi:hypothetical protein